MNNLRTSPLSSCKNHSPYFFMVHLLHRLYDVDAPGYLATKCSFHHDVHIVDWGYDIRCRRAHSHRTELNWTEQTCNKMMQLRHYSLLATRVSVTNSRSWLAAVLELELQFANWSSVQFSSVRRLWTVHRRRTELKCTKLHYATIRYDTRCYFNVRSKADMSQRPIQ